MPASFVSPAGDHACAGVDWAIKPPYRLISKGNALASVHSDGVDRISRSSSCHALIDDRNPSLSASFIPSLQYPRACPTAALRSLLLPKIKSSGPATVLSGPSDASAHQRRVVPHQPRHRLLRSLPVPARPGPASAREAALGHRQPPACRHHTATFALRRCAAARSCARGAAGPERDRVCGPAATPDESGEQHFTRSKCKQLATLLSFAASHIRRVRGHNCSATRGAGPAGAWRVLLADACEAGSLFLVMSVCIPAVPHLWREQNTAWLRLGPSGPSCPHQCQAPYAP